ncbi:hypothetical protein EVAR_58068_1 [Eumeta japonica]|uniref:Uncharacterized protein n=1 Tax=Eumeta variegata TaxID=151549 RepID=A0A4C2A970_EUMVA|nr:hypothetical protein EVAR_58068_1 [Eumeta japonica]
MSSTLVPIRLYIVSRSVLDFPYHPDYALGFDRDPTLDFDLVGFRIRCGNALTGPLSAAAWREGGADVAPEVPTPEIYAGTERYLKADLTNTARYYRRPFGRFRDIYGSVVPGAGDWLTFMNGHEKRASPPKERSVMGERANHATINHDGQFQWLKTGDGPATAEK